MPGCVMFVGVAIWLAAFLGGTWFLHRAVKRRSGAHWFGAVLLLGPLLLHAMWCHRTDVDQWSPHITDRHPLHGRWTHGGSTLELFANGTFRFEASGEAARRVHLTHGAGRWDLEDWNLTLYPEDGYARRLRVVVSNGAYRIIEAPGDLDTWPPWSGFNRSPASPAPDPH